MHLKKLKLVGFKSFVDATTIEFPSALVAVVGPNGCGKSNVIDAVRWVMGESSAKHLRGESMADVIFNGSSQRKPLGQASVELVFENNAGRLLGEYASYSEISIKRLVTREGTSTYYLNNVRVRRKDVIDIFLGTGLGPRSYSIISQGMVSQIVEAKPDDLRGFLEEAAGISKYKERRRETENRIRHTRENLERVNDIRQELAKQIDKLARQAQVAKRYRQHKEDEATLTERLALIRIKTYQNTLVDSEKRLKEKELAIEKKQAELTELLKTLEADKLSLNEQEEAFNQAQGEFYQKGRELAKMEEGIKAEKAKKKQLLQDKEECAFALKEYQTHIQSLLEKSEILQEDIEEIIPRHSEIEKEKTDAQTLVQQKEKAQRAWQENWDKFNQALNSASQTASKEQTKVQHLEQTINNLSLRVERLSNEKTTLTFTELEEEQKSYQQKSEVLSLQQQEHQASLDLLSEQIEKQEAEKAALVKNIKEVANWLNENKARLASLEALQEVALGKQNEDLSHWLKEKGLDVLPRLAEKMEVASGFEVAVESCFDYLLRSVLIDEDKFKALDLDNANELPLSLAWQSQQVASTKNLDETYLASHIDTPLLYLKEAAAKIRVAKDLASAKAMLETLAIHESIITKDGIFMGQGFIKFPGKESVSDNLLAREKAISRLGLDITAAEEKMAKLSKTEVDMSVEIKSAQAQKEDIKTHIHQQNIEISELKGKDALLSQRLSQFKQRISQIEEELVEHHEAIEDNKMALQDSKEAWQAAVVNIEQQSEKREHFIKEREDISESLNDARNRFNQLSHEYNQKSFALNAKQQERMLLLETKEKETARLERANEKALEIQKSLEALSDEKIEQNELNLQQNLKAHQTLENSMATLKSALLEKKDAVSLQEKQMAEVREALSVFDKESGEIKLARQSDVVRLQTLIEELAKTEEELPALIDALSSEYTETETANELEIIKNKIHRLGAVNLAAIEEHEEELERKGYLDAQCLDLEEALKTLETAIAKIDKESRHRFKETFELVNTEFKRLFPRLFGGGRAELICDSDDLLETGVTVMAQPPGKRNSTIHLLSGGEKAMTAVALVFSIFQLNPSPFCMLDEVDAPLDDANVTRFTKLVKEMSEQVQFIFITHNKLTMALASHLSGVTMNEPGVSRIVSVDVKEAIELAE